jgi:ribosomal protein L40E
VVVLIMKCSQCGVENPDNAQFCGGCGHSFKNELVCSYCGHVNPKNYNFCNQCGHSLTRLDDSDPKQSEVRNLTGEMGSLSTILKIDAGVEDPDSTYYRQRYESPGKDVFKHFIFLETLSCDGKDYIRGWDADVNVVFLEELVSEKIKVRYEEFGENNLITKTLANERLFKLLEPVQDSTKIPQSKLNPVIHNLFYPDIRVKPKIAQLIEAVEQALDRSRRAAGHI